MNLYKRMALISLIILMPTTSFSAIYYRNGVPVETETSTDMSYGSTIISNGNSMTIIESTPVIIQNGTTVIIRRDHEHQNDKVKTDQFNSGEQKQPNNGIVRPGTSYLSGDGTVRQNSPGKNSDINIQTEIKK